MQSLIRPKDLTQGRPLPALTLYALPMFASMFFQQAYNLADSWIAGNCIGPVALGAVGTCYPITMVFIAMASGLGIGTSICCSQKFGAREFDTVRTAIRTALICFLPLSLLLTAVSIPASPLALKLLAVPQEAMGATGEYLRFYLAGLPFLFLYNMATGILNGLGNSRTPLLFLIASSALNIVLDFFLVIIVPLGVAGLALATLLSQAASALATLWAVGRMYRGLGTDDAVIDAANDAVINTRNDAVSDIINDAADDTATDAVRREPLVSLTVLGELLRLAIPSIIQHVFMSAGQLVMQNVINSYGLVVMAGYSVAFRINGLVVNTLMALSNALSGFIAQNKGAGKNGRITDGLKVALIIGYIYSSLAVLLLLLKGPAILAFFVGAEADGQAIIGAGMGFIRIVSPFYLLVCFKIICDGALRGIGSMTLFMFSTISDVLVRMFCAGAFSNLWGISGVWWIWPFAWLIGTAVSAASWAVKRPR